VTVISPMSRKPGRRAAPAVVTILRAFITRAAPFEWAAIAPASVEHALEIGLGPVLASVAHNTGTGRDLVFADRIRAADLTARALTAARYETLSDVLSAARGAECQVVLLKGAATALCYYPEPHLRTTGDIDVLVPADRQASLEAKLRSHGFQQRSRQPAAAFVDFHHSMPFCCVRRGTWVDVHSRVCPPGTPHAHDPIFSWGAIASQLSPVAVGTAVAYRMDHELQLIYTSVRWAESFNPARGVYPILDAALLVHKHGHTLDWDRIITTVGRSGTATALHVMLSYLDTWALAPVPPTVLETLAARDRSLNRFSIGLLHRLVTAYIMDGRPFGRTIATQGHLESLWRSVLGSRSPIVNLVSAPYHVACPPGHPDRFSLPYAMRRFVAFARRTVPKGTRDRPS
jgi:hypothetical protein